MLALDDLQREMRLSLLGEARPALARAIAGDGLSWEARLAVHRNNLFASLTDALGETFPVVRRLVDPRFFAYACRAYIAAEPPAGPCLFEYGASFPDFLARFEPCRGLPYLPDVARFEWLQNEVLHAADAESLDASLLSALTERSADLAFRFQPAYRLLRSPYPVDAIWRANQPHADPEGTVDLGAGAAILEIRRLGDEVVFRPLDPADHAFRAALAAGSRLGEAASRGIASNPSFDLALALRRLIADGVLAGYSLTSPQQETPP
jgi:hypothetical protein